jgi:hypothetical protein
MSSPSRYTITAERATIAQLAGRSVHQRQIAAGLTFVCSDGKLNRSVLKFAAEGVADVVVAAQLPLVATPDKLTAALEQHGIPADLAQAAVASIAASNSIKSKAEQPNDRQACDLLTSYLVASPYLGGVKTVVPTPPLGTPANAKPEPSADIRPPQHENVVAVGDYPPVHRPTDADADADADTEASS